MVPLIPSSVMGNEKFYLGSVSNKIWLPKSLCEIADRYGEPNQLYVMRAMHRAVTRGHISSLGGLSIMTLLMKIMVR